MPLADYELSKEAERRLADIYRYSIRKFGLRTAKRYLTEMHEAFAEGEGLYNTDEEKDFIEKAYTLCTNISIDYGIMEKASNVCVVPAEFGWSDLGTWASLPRVGTRSNWE